METILILIWEILQKLEAEGKISWEKTQSETETGSKIGRKEAEVTKKPDEEKNLGEENKNNMLRVNNMEQLVGFILTIMMITLTNIYQ